MREIRLIIVTSTTELSYIKDSQNAKNTHFPDQIVILRIMVKKKTYIDIRGSYVPFVSLPF